MPIVMFWSPDQGHGKTSSHTAITAITAALQYRKQLLLCHTGKRGCGVEYSIMADMNQNTSSAWQEKAGVDRLRYLYQSGILNSNHLTAETISVVRDRLHLLPGTRYSSLNQGGDLAFWQFALYTASQHYDLILMDAGSGEEQLPLLTAADLIVINLSQHAEQLDHFFGNKMYQEWFHSGRCLPVIGIYNAANKINQQEINRRYKLTDSIHTIDYCQSFSDAWNTQHLLSFMRHRLILDWPEKQNGRFFRQSFLLTSGIMGMLEQHPVNTLEVAGSALIK